MSAEVTAGPWRLSPAGGFCGDHWYLEIGASEVVVYQPRPPVNLPAGTWVASVRLGAGASPHVVVLAAQTVEAARLEAVGLLSKEALERVVMMKAVARACNALLAAGA